MEEHKARFRQRLGETLAWLQHMNPFRVDGERVVRLSPLRVDDEWAADRPEVALERVVSARSATLRGPWALPSTLPPGRLLLVLTDFNLKDGACVEPSGGFVGDYNLPMCDCWVDYFERVPVIGAGPVPALACWVPANLVGHAQRAARVNPEECLVWADEFAPGFFDVGRGDP